MRSSLLLTVAAFLTIAPSLSGRCAYASSPSDKKGNPAAGTTAAATTVYRGRVLSPDGPLPGAIVVLVGTKLMAVTNAEGEFSFTVPVRRSPLRITASYAGFEAETLTVASDEHTVTLELATTNAIAVRRGQNMKTYSRTAQREVKQSLRQL